MMARDGGLVAVVMVMLAVIPVARPATLFGALSRGFQAQEEVSYISPRQATGEFEVRQYAEKNWVCTLQKDTEDQITVFLRLFGYIDGKNDRNERLVMGIPVSIEARQHNNRQVLEACFFIPEKSQANPPRPTNSLVFIEVRPAMTVFTRKFGGFATDESTWKTEAAALRQLVEASGNTINPSVSFWNAYDSPIKFWGRRNEVWLVQA